MLVNAVAGSTGDLANHNAQSRVVDLARPSAAGADNVVMVGPLANHVRVIARGKVQSFDSAEFHEDVQGSEDGGTPGTESSGSGLSYELSGREMPAVVCDQGDERPPRLSQPIARSLEDGDDRGRVHRAER